MLDRINVFYIYFLMIFSLCLIDIVLKRAVLSNNCGGSVAHKSHSSSSAKSANDKGVLLSETTSSSSTKKSAAADLYLTLVSKLNVDDAKVKQVNSMDEHIRVLLKHRDELEEAIKIEQIYKLILMQRLKQTSELTKSISELRQKFNDLSDENRTRQNEYWEKFAPNKTNIDVINFFSCP